jgi:putative transposase
MPELREKHHRLDPHVYLHHTVSLTLCIEHRQPFFTTNDRFETSLSHLMRALEETECKAEFYVFMPDHAHFILTPQGDMYSALNAANKFKQHNGYWMKTMFGHSLWQKDYFDHIIRSDADQIKQMQYAMLNPVRRQLCEQWNEYPYKGSTVHDLSSWKL